MNHSLCSKVPQTVYKHIGIEREKYLCPLKQFGRVFSDNIVENTFLLTETSLHI